MMTGCRLIIIILLLYNNIIYFCFFKYCDDVGWPYRPRREKNRLRCPPHTHTQREGGEVRWGGGSVIRPSQISFSHSALPYTRSRLNFIMESEGFYCTYQVLLLSNKLLLTSFEYVCGEASWGRREGQTRKIYYLHNLALFPIKISTACICACECTYINMHMYTKTPITSKDRYPTDLIHSSQRPCFFISIRAYVFNMTGPLQMRL